MSPLRRKKVQRNMLARLKCPWTWVVLKIIINLWLMEEWVQIDRAAGETEADRANNRNSRKNSSLFSQSKISRGNLTKRWQKMSETQATGSRPVLAMPLTRNHLRAMKGQIKMTVYWQRSTRSTTRAECRISWVSSSRTKSLSINSFKSIRRSLMISSAIWWFKSLKFWTLKVSGSYGESVSKNISERHPETTANMKSILE